MSRLLKVMFDNKSGADSEFSYKIGEVNIADNWNIDAKNSKEMGGFSYSNEENIFRWLIRGDTLYEVEIPDDASVVKVDNPSTPDGVFRTNKIIVKNPIKVNDEILLTAITPDELQYAFSDSDNEMCLMLRLDYGNSSFIFTGDISSFAEKYAVNKYKNMLKADVLKVAHHGSRNSSCDEFLKAVSPTYAYIPVGNNSFGHPHQDAIKRFKDNDIEVYRSDIHKDVTFYFDAEKIKGVIYDKSVLEAIK